MHDKNDYLLITQNDKTDFANHIRIQPFVIDEIEKLTNLGLPEQTDLTANKQEKYVCRSYFKNEVGFGIFSFFGKRLYLAFLELYNDPAKRISVILQNEHVDFLAVDTPIDDGYWLYIDLTELVLDRQNLQKEIDRIIKLVHP